MEEAPQQANEDPARPPSVPAGAVWLADHGLWELADRAPDGEKHGEVRQWRPDGTLYLRGRNERGQAAGPFAILHPNGELAREGAFVAGELDGVVTAYGSAAETPEVLRSCCVPDNAWKMKGRWERGRLLGETFYDRDGHILLSDGTRRPARPAGVPESAEFDEFGGRWGDGPLDENRTWIGRWRFWTVDGRLDEEAEYAAGGKRWSRQYDAQGAVRQEVSFVGDAVLHGPYRRRFVDGDESPYADPRLVDERGSYEDGHAVGRWIFSDAAGSELRALDFGPVIDAVDVPKRAVFADERRGPAHWSTLAQALRAEGRAREAACAMARAAAQGGTVEGLRVFLEETTIRLTPAASDRALAALADEKGTLARALDALVGGADPAAVLRMLASICPGTPHASADFIEAAILLAPERRMAYMTRALLRLELGDPTAALADAAQVAGDSPDAAAFLRTYTRLLFPTFDFWPARLPLESALEDLPETPVQPLEAVQRAIQLYATRLERIRAALAARVPGASWVPSLARLLPEGPLELRAYDVEIVDETDQGPEASTVRVDEALALDGWTVPSLMRLARTQWCALAWLCWSAGLRDVALPAAIDPPDDFPKAAGMAIVRYLRAQDAVVTGGLRSMTAGVPGFVWEDIDIEGIPRHFAEMAQAEYLEMRAVFLFLMSPENVSPFQADLRAT